jgi:hypothetical protein
MADVYTIDALVKKAEISGATVSVSYDASTGKWSGDTKMVVGDEIETMSCWTGSFDNMVKYLLAAMPPSKDR